MQAGKRWNPRKASKKKRQVRNGFDPTEDEIRERAYEIYLARGSRLGSALQDGCKPRPNLRQGRKIFLTGVRFSSAPARLCDGRPQGKSERIGLSAISDEPGHTARALQLSSPAERERCKLEFAATAPRVKSKQVSTAATSSCSRLQASPGAIEIRGRCCAQVRNGCISRRSSGQCHFIDARQRFHRAPPNAVAFRVAAVLTLGRSHRPVIDKEPSALHLTRQSVAHVRRQLR